jgi:hypothetical protein
MFDPATYGWPDPSLDVGIKLLIKQGGVHPWPISALKWRIFADLQDEHDPTIRFMELQIFESSARYRSEVLGPGLGLLLVPWPHS